MHSLTFVDGLVFGLGMQVAGLIVGIVSAWTGQVTK
jgi:hypothetical protein